MKGEKQVIDGWRKGAQETLDVFKGPTDGQPSAKPASKRKSNAGAVVLINLTIPMFWWLGTEFMPPMDDGSILYMPSTMPVISIAESPSLLQLTDRVVRGSRKSTTSSFKRKSSK